MKIDISNLKKTTEEAIKRGKAEAARSEQEKAALKVAQDTELVKKANKIIKTIPAKCQAAAEKGLKATFIMEERSYNDAKSTFVDRKWVSQIVGGPGVLVIEACQKAGLKVDVRHCYDDMNSWAEIYVSWD